MKNIKIGGKHYKINIAPLENYIEKEADMPNRPEALSGFIDYKRSEIFIEKDMDTGFVKENLVHELLHALLDRKNLELITRQSTLEEAVENIVEYLTPRFHAFLEDNPTFQQDFLNLNKDKSDT